MKKVHVAAAVLEQGGRLLAVRRNYGEYKGFWEFPGGKIEPGESPREALERELREELEIDADVGERIGCVEFDYPEFHLSMECFRVRIVSGEIRLQVHDLARWLTADRLDSVNWLPADLEILDRIRAGM